MALAVYTPFPEDDSNLTNHDLVSKRPRSPFWPFDLSAFYDPAPNSAKPGHHLARDSLEQELEFVCICAGLGQAVTSTAVYWLGNCEGREVTWSGLTLLDSGVSR